MSLKQITYKIISIPSKKSEKICSRLKQKLTAFKETNSLNPNYLFVIGGDGTFIKQAIIHNKPNVKIIGINGGSLGFYSAFSENDLDNLITNLKSYKFLPINILKIKFNGKKVNAVNELSITSSTAYPLNIYFNGQYYQKFRGTGILVGTRTGSTGYIKSAKGAIVFPGIECLEFVELDPLLHVGFISVQSPLILPASTKITIEPAREYVQNENCPRVYADGNQIIDNFCSDKIFIELEKTKAKFLLPNNLNSFMKKIQTTFIKGNN